jgi:hypothetical protein
MPRVNQFNDLIMYAKYMYLVVPYHEMSQIHPRFDTILARILRDVPSVHVLVVDVKESELWESEWPSEWSLGKGAGGDGEGDAGDGEKPRRKSSTETSLGQNVLVHRIRCTVSKFLRRHGHKDAGGGRGGSENEEREIAEERERVELGVNDDVVLDARRRVRAVTGLSRSLYLSLVRISNLVLDPSTNDGGCSLRTLLPSLKTMLVGTPMVTMRSEGDEWWREQPTSSVAALLESVGGDKMVTHCVARNEREYAEKASALLNNASLALELRSINRREAWAYVERQNKQVETSWLTLVERVGRSYANWRVGVDQDK